MDQVRSLTSLSHDELIARIEQHIVVLELRDAEIRELHAVNSALLAERDALREALLLARDRIESERRSGELDPLLRDIEAALGQGQEES